MGSYRGLTWDHPRGRDALVEASVRRGIDLVWEVQPLSGFESTPISELAERYDVIVLDHPHLGDAKEHLQPVDELLEGEFVGPSVASYRLDGHLWALPLDAATQVAATRTDLAGPPPRLWREVVELSRAAPVALSVAGPHALLTFSSISVALGEEPTFAPTDTAHRALELMTDLTTRAPRHTRSLDPIALLDTMVADDTIAHCPLIYGYVNYAPTVTFTDAPSERPGSRPGSTIGGTGLAITRRCRPTAELLDHLRWLLSATAQEMFVPQYSGQPARLSAWTSDAVNVRTGDFYRGTLRTISEAWVRPRQPGYIEFQTAASEVARDVVYGEVTATAGLDRIATLWKGIGDE
ncbi:MULTISPECIES: ABC transporter substrate-binding protein [Kribbella]|uniref:Extracellular solute-binding protein n=1 Tax=Kribbella karoonensis TaxID=324851 RepID=A0ABP4NT53_9ACTN